MVSRMATGGEKNAINGRVIPMEDYGSIKNPISEDRVNILEEDELVRTYFMFGCTVLSHLYFFWQYIHVH